MDGEGGGGADIGLREEMTRSEGERARERDGFCDYVKKISVCLKTRGLFL